MNVQDLIDVLEGFDPDAEIMIAHQPSWPLAETLADVVEADDENEGDDEAAPGDTDASVVWLVAGGHSYSRSPYAPKHVFSGVL